AVFNDDQRGHVITVFPREIQCGRRCAACLMWNEDAAGIQTLEAWRVLHERGALNDSAGIVSLVAGARFRSTGSSRRYETATVGAFRRHATGGSVHRARQATHPAVEIVPTEQSGGGMTGFVVLGAREVEFAEEATFVIRLLEQLGSCHSKGRQLR